MFETQRIWSNSKWLMETLKSRIVDQFTILSPDTQRKQIKTFNRFHPNLLSSVCYKIPTKLSLKMLQHILRKIVLEEHGNAVKDRAFFNVSLRILSLLNKNGCMDNTSTRLATHWGAIQIWFLSSLKILLELTLNSLWSLF